MPTTPLAGALLYGTRWGAAASEPSLRLTYSFPGEASDWDFLYAYTRPGESSQGFSPLLEGAERQAVREALQAWSAVAGLAFIQVSDAAGTVGDIRVAFTSWQMGPTQLGSTYAPNASANGGDVWLNSNLRSSALASFEPGTVGYFTLLHELGHALGLKHPNEPSPLSTETLDPLLDSMFQTVMSANVWPGIVGRLSGNTNRYPTSPMSLDIDALQQLYGANTTSAAGDDVYEFDGEQGYLQTLFDTGGIDSLAASGTRPVRIDLNPGAWSELGQPVLIDGGQIRSAATVQIYRTTLIENARGGDGADVLVGNALDNRLMGGAGNDRLDGGPGNDTAIFSGPLQNYRLQKSGGIWTVIDDIGAEGRDTLKGMEAAAFANQTVPLANPLSSTPQGLGQNPLLLFDAVYYLASHAELLPVQSLATAAQHYLASGASSGLRPNAYFDAAYYQTRWADLLPLNLDDAALFVHFNLFGVWEGRSPAPLLDTFDGNQYLAANPDVAAYVDAHLPVFLGSRSNGALAHLLLYGADEGRAAVDTAGEPINLGYSLDFG